VEVKGSDRVVAATQEASIQEEKDWSLTWHYWEVMEPLRDEAKRKVLKSL
jgi:hypothetical protein